MYDPDVSLPSATMELVGVHVLRYRSVEDQWLPIGPMTVLFGRNGVGKSNILEAVYSGMFGVNEHGSGRSVEQGGARDGWMQAEFIARLPDAWTRDHPDQVLFGRFIAGLAGALRSSHDDEVGPETARHLLDNVIVKLVADLPHELADVIRTTLSDATTEPVLIFLNFGEGVRLGISSTVHARHRPDIVHHLAGSPRPLPAWVESLARLVDRDEVAVVEVDPVQLEQPWHYPPLGYAGPDDDLNEAASRCVWAAYHRLKEPDADEPGEWSVPVQLPAQPISYSSLDPVDPGSGRVVVPGPNQGTATVTAPWLAALDAVERHANGFLPPFAHEIGPLRLYPTPDEFASYRRRRSVLDEDGDIVEVDDPPEESDAAKSSLTDNCPGVLVYAGVVPAVLLSSATRRWISLALQLAGEELFAGQVVVRDALDTEYAGDRADAASRSWAGLHGGPVTIEPGKVRPLLIIDEPELHLHAEAQREVSTWLLERASEGATVIVATHSPVLLGLPPDRALLLRVDRDDIGQTKVSRFRDVLGELKDDSKRLGVERADWLQVVRGIVVVEGEHDLKVLRKLFGEELADERLALHAIRGTKNALALVDSDFLAGCGKPLWVMFDNVRAARLRRGPSEGGSRMEEDVARHLLRLRDDGHPLEVVAYEDPDIICGLPEAAVARAFPKAAFTAWSPVIESFRIARDKAHTAPHMADGDRRGPSANRAENFKAFALKKIGILDCIPGRFVDEVLAAVGPGDRPGRNLRRAVDELLAGARAASP